MKLSDSKVCNRLALLERPCLGELTQELKPMDAGYYLSQRLSPRLRYCACMEEKAMDEAYVDLMLSEL